MSLEQSTLSSVYRLPWVLAVTVLLASVAELAFVPVAWTASLLIPLWGNFFSIGFILGLLLAGVGRYLQGRPELVRRFALWSPMILGLTIGMGAGVSGGVFGWGEFALAMLGGVGAAFLLQRILPTLAPTPDGFFAPACLTWVVVASTCIAAAGDRMETVSTLMLGVPPVVGAAAVLLQVFHGAFSRWRNQTLWLFTGGATAAGAAIIVGLASWLPELNASLKLLTAVSVALGVSVVMEPITRRWTTSRAGIRLALAGCVCALAFTGSMSLDVDKRFGGLDRRSVAATATRVLSSYSDGDGDGFYSGRRGGNDCDDDDATRHPLATTEERTCLPDGDLSLSMTPVIPYHDVLLVIVDALRADEFDSPDKRGRWPALASLATESVRFETAYAPGNSTFTSLPSMLSGIGPQLVLSSLIDSDPAPYSDLMTGEWVFDNVSEHRCTAMIVAAHEETEWLFPLYPSNVDVRAMESIVDENNHSSAWVPGAVRRGLEECKDRPTLFVLYMDDPHLEGVSGHSCSGGQVGGIECYYEEIAAVDKAFAEIVAEYQTRGRWDDTAVVFTSDHGEAFGERGHLGHTSNVFEEQVRVPLWMRVPGEHPEAVDVPVSGLSVAPTIVALAGGEPSEAVYPGLTSFLQNPDVPYPAPVTASATGRVKLGWTSPRTAIVEGRLKLIYDWATTHVELYDLDSDPGETVNLAPQRARDVERLRQRLLTTERALLLRK